MLRQFRDWYRATMYIPLTVYSFEAATSGEVEWRETVVGRAPAIALRMRSGAVASFRPKLWRPFTFNAVVALEPMEEGECIVTVSARQRGAVLRRRSVTLRCGDPPVPLQLRVPSGQSVELVLTAEDTARPMWVSWGSPIALVPKSWARLGRTACAAARSAWVAAGPAGIMREAVVAFRTFVGEGEEGRYDRWVARHRLSRAAIEQMRHDIDQFSYRPVVSLVLTASGASEGERLRRCAASVEAQYYPHWELSRAPRVGDGYRVAKGEFVALLACDGELAPEALFEVVRALNDSPATDLVYCDEDRLDDGHRRQPFFKPNWSPEYCLSRLYLGQFAVYRKAIVDAVGGVGDGEAAASDLLLRVIEKTSRIHHVPKVLWHSFAAPPVSASGSLADYVRRSRLEANVIDGLEPGRYRVKWKIRGSPVVSVIILTRDRLHLLRRCLRSIEVKTREVRYEIIVVDNGSVEEETHRFLAGCEHRVVRDPAPFNFARLNNLGARHARGDHLLFLNNDTEVIDGEWLLALLELSQQEPIGAVGAKLYYPDGRLQHVGMVLGIKQGVAQVFRGAPGAHSGYFDSALVVRNYLAVTGACLMTRRSLFDSVSGFNEAFATDYNDVDYCLRVRAHGYRVVFTPHARLWHHEFVTRERRVAAAEHELFCRLWASEIAADPYFNPNLSRRYIDFRVDV